MTRSRFWLFSCVLTIIGSAAHAGDWTGHWIGKGTVTDPSGTTRLCSWMEIAIKEIEGEDGSHSLWLISGLPNCGAPTAFRDPIFLGIQGETLTYEEKKIGTLSQQKLQILKYSRGFKEAIEVVRSPRALGFRNWVSVLDPRGSYLVEGVLEPLE